MHVRHLALLMVLQSAGSFLMAQTVGVPLTLQQAIDLARTKNPTLLSGQQHVTATKASEVTAGLRQNPTFTFSGENVTLAADNPGTLDAKKALGQQQDHARRIRGRSRL